MIDGTYILIAIAALALLLAGYVYAEWEAWDSRRRHERRVKVNLQRMGGR